jgi:hypothetical protein
MTKPDTFDRIAADIRTLAADYRDFVRAWPPAATRILTDDDIREFADRIEQVAHPIKVVRSKGKTR